MSPALQRPAKAPCAPQFGLARAASSSAYVGGAGIAAKERKGGVADFTQMLREGRFALKFAAVSLVGLGVDAALLQLGVGLGADPAWARLVSLLAALQVSFVLNGLFVFHSLMRGRIARQWAGYMVANGVGNVFNYAIFVGLIASGWPIVSDRLVALGIGAFTAWLVNFAGTRFVVLREAKIALETLGTLKR